MTTRKVPLRYTNNPLYGLLRRLHPDGIAGVAEHMKVRRSSIYYWIKKGYIPDDRANEVLALAKTQEQEVEIAAHTQAAFWARFGKPEGPNSIASPEDLI